MRASAVLVWLKDGEDPTLESFGPAQVLPPPSPNPEAWWCLEDAIKHVIEVDRDDHNKAAWIKTAETILGPHEISRAYTRLARGDD
jgi:hypothetical protein